MDQLVGWGWTIATHPRAWPAWWSVWWRPQVLLAKRGWFLSGQIIEIRRRGSGYVQSTELGGWEDCWRPDRLKPHPEVTRAWLFDFMRRPLDLDYGGGTLAIGVCAHTLRLLWVEQGAWVS